VPTNSEAEEVADPRHPAGGPRAGRRRARAATLAAPAVLLLLLPACGDDGRVPLYRAEGRVEVGGEPAEGVQVVLHPADRPGDLDALRPRGTTGPDGSFEVGTFEPGDGAPAGRYVATLFWPDVPPGPTPPNDLLGGRHADPATSGLEVTIPEGPTELEPFRVEAAPRAPTRRPPTAPDVDGMAGPGG
jgi:hypothetical protein